MMEAIIVPLHYRHGHEAKGGMEKQNAQPNGCFGQSGALLSVARPSF